MNARAGSSRSQHDDQPAREAPRKRTRPNTALACARCRSRKVKCDGGQPSCGRCFKDPDQPECFYNEERARQSFKAQNQALRDRILVLESALQSHQPAPPSTPQLEQAMFTGARDEEQDDHDEAVPVTTIGTGSFTLGSDGSLFHSGHNSSFFRTQAVQLEEKPDPRLAHFVNYLLPPYLPFAISSTLHDQLIALSFERMTRFGNPIDEVAFCRDLRADASQRTASYSRFLHLLLLGTGCRYLQDAPSYLCQDRSQATRGFAFIDAAKELVDSEGESPKLSSLSGFLLLSSFQVGLGKDRLAWMYQGIAMMIALDFQLDQDARIHLPPLSQSELLLDAARHRTYWGLSIVPHQPLPVVDIMDPNSGGKTSYVFNARLSKIAIKIVTIIYTSGGERNRQACSPNRLECVVKLDNELEAWHASLPPILRLNDLPLGSEASPDVVVLNMFYNVSTIVLHRPFINGGNNTTSLSRCSAASSEIVALLGYASTTSYGQLGLPLHTQHATFCAGTVLLLFAAGLDTSGNVAEQAERVSQAKEDLDRVIAFLHAFGAVWPAASESSQALTNLSVDYLL